MKRSWSSHEIERLRCLWNSDIPTFQIGEMLGRSAAAVIAEAARLREAGEPLAYRNAAGRRR